jgi:hypothetical protein
MTSVPDEAVTGAERRLCCLYPDSFGKVQAEDGDLFLVLSELKRLRTVELAAKAVAEDWAVAYVANVLDGDLLDTLMESVGVKRYDVFGHIRGECRSQAPTDRSCRPGQRCSCACGRTWLFEKRPGQGSDLSVWLGERSWVEVTT